MLKWPFLYKGEALRHHFLFTWRYQKGSNHCDWARLEEFLQMGWEKWSVHQLEWIIRRFKLNSKSKSPFYIFWPFFYRQGECPFKIQWLSYHFATTVFGHHLINSQIVCHDDSGSTNDSSWWLLKLANCFSWWRYWLQKM